MTWRAANRSPAVRSLLCATALCALTVVPARSQVDPQPAPTGYVTREEYDRLRREQEAMRRELEALKEERSGGAPPATRSAGPGDAATQADVGLINETIRQIRADVDRHHLAENKFAIYGDAAFGFTAQKHSPSSFDAGIAPLVLWKPTDRILIEAAADIGVSTDPDGSSGTSFDLTIANASYLVNDWLLVGAGLFVVPFGQYHNHFDPPWINKLPDDPLPFADGGIAPGSQVGVFAKGAVPVTTTWFAGKLTYDAYATNGPNLVTTDPGAAGTLNYDDFSDLNNNKAFGGRIGFLPVPNLEVGYSIQASEPNPGGFQRVHSTAQAIDLNWKQDVDSLYGILDVRAEWVWSDVGKATYDPTGSLGFGPTRFTNSRQGGYVQVAFRPFYVENEVVRNLELVARYDQLNGPLSAPGGEREKRVAIGLDYWLSPQTVLKTAYEFDFKKSGDNADAFFVQLGLRL